MSRWCDRRIVCENGPYGLNLFALNTECHLFPLRSHFRLSTPHFSPFPRSRSSHFLLVPIIIGAFLHTTLQHNTVSTISAYLYSSRRPPTLFYRLLTMQFKFKPLLVWVLAVGPALAFATTATVAQDATQQVDKRLSPDKNTVAALAQPVERGFFDGPGKLESQSMNTGKPGDNKGVNTELMQAILKAIQSQDFANLAKLWIQFITQGFGGGGGKDLGSDQDLNQRRSTLESLQEKDLNAFSQMLDNLSQLWERDEVEQPTRRSSLPVLGEGLSEGKGHEEGEFGNLINIDGLNNAQINVLTELIKSLGGPSGGHFRRTGTDIESLTEHQRKNLDAVVDSVHVLLRANDDGNNHLQKRLDINVDARNPEVEGTLSNVVRSIESSWERFDKFEHRRQESIDEFSQPLINDKLGDDAHINILTELLNSLSGSKHRRDANSLIDGKLGDDAHINILAQILNGLSGRDESRRSLIDLDGLNNAQINILSQILKSLSGGGHEHSKAAGQIPRSLIDIDGLNNAQINILSQILKSLSGADHEHSKPTGHQSPRSLVAVDGLNDSRINVLAQLVKSLSNSEHRRDESHRSLIDVNGLNNAQINILSQILKSLSGAGHEQSKATGQSPRSLVDVDGLNDAQINVLAQLVQSLSGSEHRRDELPDQFDGSLFSTDALNNAQVNILTRILNSMGGLDGQSGIKPGYRRQESGDQFGQPLVNLDFLNNAQINILSQILNSFVTPTCGTSCGKHRHPRDEPSRRSLIDIDGLNNAQINFLSQIIKSLGSPSGSIPDHKRRRGEATGGSGVLTDLKLLNDAQVNVLAQIIKSIGGLSGTEKHSSILPLKREGSAIDIEALNNNQIELLSNVVDSVDKFHQSLQDNGAEQVNKRLVGSLIHLDAGNDAKINGGSQLKKRLAGSLIKLDFGNDAKINGGSQLKKRLAGSLIKLDFGNDAKIDGGSQLKKRLAGSLIKLDFGNDAKINGGSQIYKRLAGSLINLDAGNDAKINILAKIIGDLGSLNGNKHKGQPKPKFPTPRDEAQAREQKDDSQTPLQRFQSLIADNNLDESQLTFLIKVINSIPGQSTNANENPEERSLTQDGPVDQTWKRMIVGDESHATLARRRKSHWHQHSRLRTKWSPGHSRSRKSSFKSAEHDSTSDGSKDGSLTFYSGHMLDNPACGGHTPKSTEMVVALPSNLMHHCGDAVKITHNGKSVYATAVDECADCGANHIDVSPQVFKFFADLDVGELHGISYKFEKDGPTANHEEYGGLR